MKQYAASKINKIVHQPVRFSIMAALLSVKKAEFGLVRDAVGINDSQLSRQVSVLEKSGYVKVEKGYVGKRPRTWLSLTAKGKNVFEEHLGILRQISSQGI